MTKKVFLSIVLVIMMAIIIPVKVSAASLLSDLKVEGIGSLNLAKKSWNLTLTTTLDYANIMATPANESVTVEGIGKVKVNEGANTIVVKATDGTNTEEFTININVIKGSYSATDGQSVKNPKTGENFIKETFIIDVIAVLSIVLIIKNKKKLRLN